MLPRGLLGTHMRCSRPDAGAATVPASPSAGRSAPGTPSALPVTWRFPCRAGWFLIYPLPVTSCQWHRSAVQDSHKSHTSQADCAPRGRARVSASVAFSRLAPGTCVAGTSPPTDNAVRQPHGYTRAHATGPLHAHPLR